MALPNTAAGTVAAVPWTIINSNFCGFLIKKQDLPSFWAWAYWISPMHYAFEGIVMTQFHDDHTVVTTFTGGKTTAEAFISEFYSAYKYSNRGQSVLALVVISLILR